MSYNCTSILNKLLHELFQTRTSSANCVSTKGFVQGLHHPYSARFNVIWVGDQEGQSAILAARLALSLRRWVRLLQAGMSTE